MKNEIIEYVMNSPGNTNRAVLESMLQTISSERPIYLMLNEQTEVVESLELEDDFYKIYKLTDYTPNVEELERCVIAIIESGIKRCAFFDGVHDENGDGSVIYGESNLIPDPQFEFYVLKNAGDMFAEDYGDGVYLVIVNKAMNDALLSQAILHFVFL